MSMHGKVHEWKMTEAERLAYIKKHPIVSYEKPSGSTFVEIHDSQYKKAKEDKKIKDRVIDGLDKDAIHKMYMEGETLNAIAKKNFVSRASIAKLIQEQRELEPEKWPYKQVPKGRKADEAGA